MQLRVVLISVFAYIFAPFAWAEIAQEDITKSGNDRGMGRNVEGGAMSRGGRIGDRDRFDQGMRVRVGERDINMLSGRGRNRRWSSRGRRYGRRNTYSFDDRFGGFHHRRIGRPIAIDDSFYSGPFGFSRHGYGLFRQDWSFESGICENIPEGVNVVAPGPGHFPSACGKCIGIRHDDVYERAYVSDCCNDCVDNQILLNPGLYSRYGSFATQSLPFDWDFIDC